MKNFCTRQRILNITNSTNIHLVAGSILSRDIAEGVAVFIPGGFRHLTIDGKKFFHEVTGYELPGSLDAVEIDDPMHKLKYILCMELFARSEKQMEQQLTDVLDYFSRCSVKSIAMNGIYCDCASQRPERCQLEFIIKYLVTNETYFEDIYLVDLCGGFNKYCRASEFRNYWPEINIINH